MLISHLPPPQKVQVLVPVHLILVFVLTHDCRAELKEVVLNASLKVYAFFPMHMVVYMGSRECLIIFTI